jgi:hypothetical protein
VKDDKSAKSDEMADIADEITIPVDDNGLANNLVETSVATPRSTTAKI